jgi:carbon storage regulator
MLILTRRRNEQIIIDGDITITVIDFARGQVRLGITAPPEVPVHREEVQVRLLREAARIAPGLVPADET